MKDELRQLVAENRDLLTVACDCVDGCERCILDGGRRLHIQPRWPGFARPTRLRTTSELLVALIAGGVQPELHFAVEKGSNPEAGNWCCHSRDEASPLFNALGKGLDGDWEAVATLLVRLDRYQNRHPDERPTSHMRPGL